MTEPAPQARGELERLVGELEQTAVRLRDGNLDATEAAQVVERLAQLAAEVGGQLDREARAGTPGEPPGQETLL